MTAPVLECDRVTRLFRVKRGLLETPATLRAVDDVSFSVREGEVLAIVGESGCGKTTLARMLLGLLAPSGGSIRFAGRPMRQVGRTHIAARVQPVFQDPYSSLNPRKTLGRIVGLPLAVHRIGSEPERRSRVAEIMELVGLPAHLVHAYPNQLSGGQRQRVAIARALAIRPAIVVFDEPTSALDVSVQAQILNLLLELRQSLNLTYVFISHDLAVVEHIADRVAVMYLGRLVELGGTAEIFDSPRHPYTETLLRSILTPDPALGLPPGPFGGDFPDPLDPPPGCPFHPRCPSAMETCRAVPPATVTDAAGRVECHLYDGESHDR
ncbi:MAG: ATP-binding cassette domain-containing protein [Defluviicoccus sp.]|nr:ATP-binding cassette domain-containing protein [Defluviicoccus sp.]MDE0386276.1 ATP-binding cassette domain-containing protein [Defluviicoccus sp.]